MINLLDISVANLIAAGEVVDRPASAVKELLENAIDAGATKITVEIQNGGTTLMRVTDNGCGMTPEDAKLCIRRHATSKIKTAADLDGIATLGFRGEALAAISAVSKMKIMTRRPEDALGCTVECDAGNIVSAEETGCPSGTTIMAEDLFSNVPARRKFLRRDATETAAVSAVVEKIALSRPDIAIKYITDGAVRFQTEGDGRLENVVYAVLGRDFAKKTIPVHDMTEGVTVDGCIGTPENIRGTRNAENFFINGRYVRCQTASAALEQAFSSYIAKEKFPCCVLNITFNPAYVDVNVHPQKLEVKFSNEKPIFNAVYCAVRNVLRSALPRAGEENTRYSGDSFKLYNDVLTFRADNAEEAEKISDERELLKRKYEQIVIPRENPYYGKTEKTNGEEDRHENKIEKYQNVTIGKPVENRGGQEGQKCNIEDTKTSFFVENPDLSTTISTGIPPITANSAEKYTQPAVGTPVENSVDNLPDEGKLSSGEDDALPVPDYRIVGNAYNCYVFVEIGDKLLVIDKHAAHERIIFEKLKSNLQSGKPSSQILLLPLSVSLTAGERDTAEEYREELEKIGFTFNLRGITSHPSGLTGEQAKEMFCELVGRLASGEGDLQTDRYILCEKALYQASCKAAVKAGRADLDENIEWIVYQVLSRKDIRYCPHGRPVVIELTKSQIEKRFERT